MASTGINNGTLTALYIYVANVLTKVAHLTGNDMSLSTNIRDTSTKDSGGWKSGKAAQKSWSFSGSGYFAEDATGIGFEELFDYWRANTQVLIVQSSAVTGDKMYKGLGNITSLSKSNPVEDSETFEISIEGDGTLTKFTIS
jgi:TP901-1 family phage major tail protein